MTHICVSQIITIVSDNGLSPDRRQAIIWNNDGILSFGPVERHFSEILIEIYAFSFKKMNLKMSSGKWRPSCPGLNVLIYEPQLCSVSYAAHHMGNTVSRKNVWENISKKSWRFPNLTHWGRDKMAAVSQTTISNAFSWMKIYTFRLRFHWSLFERVQLTIFRHWFR